MRNRWMRVSGAWPGGQGRPVRAERSEPRSGALDRAASAATQSVRRSRPRQRSCLVVKIKRLSWEDDMRLAAAFSRLLRLDGIWVRAVHFEPGRIVLEHALRRRQLVCPECRHRAVARFDTRPVARPGCTWTSACGASRSIAAAAVVVSDPPRPHRGRPVRQAGVGLHARLRGVRRCLERRTRQAARSAD